MLHRLLPFLLLLLVSCSVTKPTGENGASAANFDKNQRELILAAGPDVPLRVFKTTSAADSVLLRTPSKDVIITPNDPALARFCQRLYATVRDSISLGVGIAAPQVGILKNIIWVQRFDKEGLPFEVYLNPVIRQYTDKKQDCMEGCLSIPNRRANSGQRAYAILIEYDKLDGTHVTEMVEDFTAVIFQHEIDHLRGILFIDYL